MASTEYDQVHVAGEVTLGGALAVSLVNDFTPMAGDSFDILDWTTRSGTFDTMLLPALSGALAWNTSQLYATGLLSVVLVGDYNQNGTVDAADYTVWRNTLGQSGTGLAADGNGSGTIDAGDYNVWKLHFGETDGAGSAGASTSQTAVPEPASLQLIGVGLAIAIVVLLTESRATLASRR